MRVKTTLKSRESKSAQDMSMIGAYSSDMMKMVWTAKPMDSLKPPDTSMSWKKRRGLVMTLRAVAGSFSGRFWLGTLLQSIVAGYLKVYDIIPKILNVYGW
jgi:hypothetical protein